MQKIKSFIWEWLAGISLIVIYLLCSAASVHAAGNAAFTHTHTDSCHKTATETCSVYHYVTYNEEYQTRYCSTCGKGTSHKLTAHTYTCTKQNDTWQPDGVCTCTVCGASATWANPPGKSHTYTVQKKVCGILETTLCLSLIRRNRNPFRLGGHQFMDQRPGGADGECGTA